MSRSLKVGSADGVANSGVWYATQYTSNVPLKLTGADVRLWYLVSSTIADYGLLKGDTFTSSAAATAREIPIASIDLAGRRDLGELKREKVFESLVRGVALSNYNLQKRSRTWGSLISTVTGC